MKRIRLILCLLVMLTLAACSNPPAAGQPTPAGNPPPPMPTASATPQLPVATAIALVTPEITPDQSQSSDLELLKNNSYTAPNYNKTITLADGKFEGGTGADYLLVQMLPQTAFGDLNQDGKDEAAILLGENGGGSGVFVSLIAVTFNNGKPVQAGSVLIDDRPKIRELSIKNGQIILNAIIHGPTDAMVNPTLAVVETFQLFNSDLILVRLTTKTPDGQDRSIAIQSPAAGTQVKGSIKVSGSLSIAPAENKLTYTIYDTKGSKLSKGPFAVKASKPGGRASFENTLYLPAMASGTPIRLVVSESSAKDGSNLAMDSVDLTIK